MSTVIEAVAIAIGVFFMFVASLGLLRMPDFYSRLHAPTKAATLGLFFLFIAMAIAIPHPVVVTKALLALVFIAATAPVGAHIMSRAAYRSGVEPGESTVVDEYAAVVERRRRRAGPVAAADLREKGELTE